MRVILRRERSATTGRRDSRGRDERLIPRPSRMKGEYGYSLTEDMPMCGPAGKALVPLWRVRIVEAGTREILPESADAQIAKDP